MINRIKKKYFVKLIALAFIFLLCSTPVLASQISAENVLKLVNQSRKQEGLITLTQNEKLTKAAEDKLNDMIENHYFSHTSPKGISPWFWFGKNGYDYQFAGENLAINFSSVEAQHKAWMASPKHKKNILNSDYREIGVAFGAGEIDGQLSLITVQEFGAIPGANIPADKEGRSFSGKDESGLIQEENKIIPQVLSVKNSIPENQTLKDYFNDQKISQPKVWSDIFQNLKTNSAAIANLISDISVLLLLTCFAIVPTAFLAETLKRIRSIFNARNKKQEILNALV